MLHYASDLLNEAIWDLMVKVKIANCCKSWSFELKAIIKYYYF